MRHTTVLLITVAIALAPVAAGVAPIQPRELIGSLEDLILGGDPPPAPPVCVYNDAEPHVLLAYARPYDEPDTFTSGGYAAHMRDVANASTTAFIAASEPHGWRIQLRVLCDPATDLPVVKNLVLPTSSASDSNVTLWRDLHDAVGASSVAKMLVHYNGNPKPGVGGEANGNMRDDQPGPENANNAWSVASVYRTTPAAPNVYLHELLHSMGAVQTSAPHSDGTGHCWPQGGDYLCNADTPPGADEPATCSSMRIDCGNDDYYHPDPPSGSYLATHWNLASSNNSYIQREQLEPEPPLIEL